MRRVQFLWMVLVIFALSGCGFHLRNHHADLDHRFPAMYLPRANSSHTLHQYLYRALLSSGVEVFDEEQKSPQAPQLIVIAETLTSQPLVYGEDGELRRERLKKTVVFEFRSGETTSLTLSTERERQLNSRQHLGDNAEKILLEREMQADIVQQLLRFLAT